MGTQTMQIVRLPALRVASAWAFGLRRDAFGPGGALNWFTLFTAAGLLVAAAFYLTMERRRRET